MITWCKIMVLRRVGNRFISYNRSYLLQWRHNEHDGVPNHPCLGCLLNRLFRGRSKKISKHCVIGLCEGNPPVTSGFPSQRASDVENVSIWWSHHATVHLNIFMMTFIIVALNILLPAPWGSRWVFPHALLWCVWLWMGGNICLPLDNLCLLCP